MQVPPAAFKLLHMAAAASEEAKGPTSAREKGPLSPRSARWMIGCRLPSWPGNLAWSDLNSVWASASERCEVTWTAKPPAAGAAAGAVGEVATGALGASVRATWE